MALSFRTTRNLGLTIIMLLFIAVSLIPSFIMVRISEPNEKMLLRLSELQKAIEINNLFEMAHESFSRYLERRGDIASVINLTDKSINTVKALERLLDEEEGTYEVEYNRYEVDHGSGEFLTMSDLAVVPKQQVIDILNSVPALMLKSLDHEEDEEA